ncbi:hypothetical protein HWV62_34833 [Athelia sp. TMB]|nr:hypothetical protein HWV62_34833 [Athelia sp. TMB]
MADELTSDSAVLQDKLGHADHITPVPVSESPTPPEGPSPSSVSEGSTAGVGETLIGWDGPDDPANPKNWPLKRRWAATLIVSAFTFISPVASSMVAPAADQIAKEFDITSSVLLSITFSIFVLGYGVGGSAPLAIGGAVLSDMFLPQERGKAVALYSLAPLLGPAYAPLLLARKADAIFKSMDPEKGVTTRPRTIYETEERSWQEIISTAVFRPFVMFWEEPILQLFGIYFAFVYGMVYLVIFTIPTIYMVKYGESIGIAGLHYISFGIGLSVAAQVNSRMLDKLYKLLSARNGGVGKPEFRLPTMFPGTLMLPIGLLLFGWAAEGHLPWVVLDIVGFSLPIQHGFPDLLTKGLIFIGAATVLAFQGITTYLVDAFGLYSASGAVALAGAACLRSLAGFGCPLFAQNMFDALGYGKGNSVLAGAAVLFGFPATWLFWTYGERIRNSSKRANRGNPAASAAPLNLKTIEKP